MTKTENSILRQVLVSPPKFAGVLTPMFPDLQSDLIYADKINGLYTNGNMIQPYNSNYYLAASSYKPADYSGQNRSASVSKAALEASPAEKGSGVSGKDCKT